MRLRTSWLHLARILANAATNYLVTSCPHSCECGYELLGYILPAFLRMRLRTSWLHLVARILANAATNFLDRWPCVTYACMDRDAFPSNSFAASSSAFPSGFPSVDSPN